MIPKYKTGTCSQCGDEDVPCSKVGKNLFCTFKCHKKNKQVQQSQKASLRSSVSKLKSITPEEKGFIDSRNSIIQDLDAVVSRYVRTRDANSDGIIKCYTCDKEITIAKAQCAHYVSRKMLITRFDAKNNLRSCCEGCNCYLDGNLKVFKQRLEEEHKGITEYLEEISREVWKPSNDELQQMLIDFRNKLRIVEQKLKQKK